MKKSIKKEFNKLKKQGVMVEGELHLPLGVMVGDKHPLSRKTGVYSCKDVKSVKKNVSKDGEEIVLLKKGTKLKSYVIVEPEQITN